jgi:hypothetical protein
MIGDDSTHTQHHRDRAIIVFEVGSIRTTIKMRASIILAVAILACVAWTAMSCTRVSGTTVNDELVDHTPLDVDVDADAPSFLEWAELVDHLESSADVEFDGVDEDEFVEMEVSHHSMQSRHRSILHVACMHACVRANA